MRKIKTDLIIILLLCANITFAQSVSYAKSLIEQGKYLEAAKQLRPLADGGNAEAQYLAAKLFFEGKGVTKNDAQGLKYANLAANQGNVDAMCLLASYYEKKDPQRFFSTFKQFIDKHPYLETGVLGLGLAGCYLNGYGTEKNEALGWSILEKNKNAEKYIKENANDYWNFKMRQVSANSLEDFADYLYSNNKSQYMKLLDYMDKQSFLKTSYLEQRVNAGNGWAMAKLAEYYYNDGQKYRAEDLAWQAKSSGSSYGEMLLKQYAYNPNKSIAATEVDLTTSINDINGYKHTVKEFLHNKLLILYFGANWCKPYQEEVPFMIELYSKYKEQGLEIIGIDLDKTKEKWNETIEKLQIPWITLCDFLVFESPILKAFGLNSIPSTICLDEKGNILEKNVKGKELEFFVKCQLRKKR